jgi:hypothetical protein
LKVENWQFRGDDTVLDKMAVTEVLRSGVILNYADGLTQRICQWVECGAREKEESC